MMLDRDGSQLVTEICGEEGSEWFRSPESIKSEIEQNIQIIESIRTNFDNSAIFIELVKKAPFIESIPVCEILLHRGGDVNHSDPETGMTPLMFIAKHRGSPSLFEWFLDHGANESFVERTNGWTVLHFAVSIESMEIIALVRTRDSLKSIRDFQGRTPSDVTNSENIKQLVQ